MFRKITTQLFVAMCFCGITCFAGANDDLIAACKAGNLEGVKKAISDGAQVNAVDAGGNPAIVSAYFWPDIVKYLLENKADPNLGTTPALFQATFFCVPDVMKLLLDAGADPNKPSVTDPSVTFKTLIEAEKNKGKEGNKDLIKAWQSAMENAKPVTMYPLPAMVMNNNCVPCLQLLLDKGAKMDLGVTDGTLVHTFAGWGASKEYRKTVFVAVKKSMEPYGVKFPEWYTNMPDDSNGNPEDILKVLLTKGLEINKKNKGAGALPDQTPLEVALGGGFGNKEEVMLALIANGADVKIKSDWYGAEILQAAQIGFASVLKAMIAKGADINEEGKCFTDASNGAQIKNFTPLTAAACKNHLEAVQYLLTSGASTQGISGSIVAGSCPAKLNNKSAIYFAIEHKNMEMVKFIAGHKGFDGKNLSISAKKMTNCVGGGNYSPSEYADELEATDIKDYLKKQGM